jgi:hypothetical protein
MNMKTTRKTLIASLMLAGIALVAVGCSKTGGEKAADKVGEAYEKTKTAVANSWSDLKDFTYDKSSDFQDRAKAMASDMDAKFEKLKADTADAKASASRSAAWEEVKNNRADLSEKVDALGDATADTWASAKANVIAAANKLEASYDKLKADRS